MRPSLAMGKGYWISHTVVVLFVLLVTQILWFIGTTTLRDFEKLQEEYLKIGDEVGRLKAAAATNPDNSSAKSLIEPLEKRVVTIEPLMRSADHGIVEWNRVWQSIIYWARPLVGSLGDQSTYARRSANSATQVMGLYILPLLYGWLGALLWVVRELRKDDSAAAIARLRPGSRVVAGMVAGPVIGMFLSPEFLNSLAFQATPFLIAFIGGYSTEVFFALADRAIRGLQEALERHPMPDAGGTEQAPRSIEDLPTTTRTTPTPESPRER